MSAWLMMRESGEMHAIAPAERRKSRREGFVVGMVLLFRRVALGYASKLYRMSVDGFVELE